MSGLGARRRCDRAPCRPLETGDRLVSGSAVCAGALGRSLRTLSPAGAWAPALALRVLGSAPPRRV